MIEFGIKDALDVLLVASLLFYVYRLMKESRSLNIFVGIMLFVLIWLFVSQVLEMRLMGSILDKLVSVGVIALIVIFQEDIRRFLYEIGSQKSMRRLVRFFHSSKESQKEANKETIMPIVLACMSMAKKYVGALIVIERGVPLKDIMDTGEEIDAKINQRLIENIFFKNSPLHDGAVVIEGDAIRPERTIVINGFSKTYAMTGWRMGYAAGPKEIISPMTKLHQCGIMSAPTMSQYAAIEALKNGDDDIAEMREQGQRMVAAAKAAEQRQQAAEFAYEKQQDRQTELMRAGMEAEQTAQEVALKRQYGSGI